MNRWGQSKLNGGKNDEGSGLGKGEIGSRQTQSPQNKAVAGKHSRQMVCPAQASKNTTANSWPASRRAVQVSGGSAVVLALRRRAQTYLTCLYPTYRLCLSLSIPTPLILKNPI